MGSCRPAPVILRSYYINMRPFVITDETRQALDTLREYAEQHPITVDPTDPSASPRVGDNLEYVREVPFGYKVVYSIELQPAGVVQHLSMSVSTPGRLPSPAVVREVATMLQFTAPPEECMIWLENIAPGHDAINVANIKEPANEPG